MFQSEILLLHHPISHSSPILVGNNPSRLTLLWWCPHMGLIEIMSRKDKAQSVHQSPKWSQAATRTQMQIFSLLGIIISHKNSCKSCSSHFKSSWVYYECIILQYCHTVYISRDKEGQIFKPDRNVPLEAWFWAPPPKLSQQSENTVGAKLQKPPSPYSSRANPSPRMLVKDATATMSTSSSRRSQT